MYLVDILPEAQFKDLVPFRRRFPVSIILNQLPSFLSWPKVGVFYP